MPTTKQRTMPAPGRCSAPRPRKASSSGPSTSNENVVRVWARMRGSMGLTEPPNSFPLKTSLPRVAAMPQQNAAPAMARYPRSGCRSAGKGLVDLFRIEPDQYLVADDDGGRGAALVGLHQLTHRREVAAHVSVFELDPSLREVGFGRIARRSARLAEDDHPLVGHRRIRLWRHLKGCIIFHRARW